MGTRIQSFHCTCCGTCCRWPGQVRLVDEDVDAMAQCLGLGVAEFTERYTSLTRDRRGLTLVEAEDGACVFLQADNRCRVNSAKPRQCREFPYAWNFPGWERLCRGEIGTE